VISSTEAGRAPKQRTQKASVRAIYLHLLSQPGALAFAWPAFLARLPMSMLGLGVVVLISAIKHSYGLASVVSATVTCAGALGGPALGALADRLGQRWVVTPAVVMHCAALTALINAALHDAPAWSLVVLGAATGASLPPVSSMVRARWSNLLGAGTLEAERAYAFEAVVDELVFMAGPVLVTALASAVAKSAGLYCSGALALTGGVLFALQYRTQPRPAPRKHGGGSAMGVAGVRVLALTCVLLGLVFGTIDVAMVAFARSHAHGALSGGLLACVAAGSGTSGVWYGSRHWHASLRRRLIAACAALTLTMSLLPLAFDLAAMAVLAFVAGFAISPTLIACFGLVEQLVPRHVLTEGFTWVSTSLAFGVGLGVTVAGRLVDMWGANRSLIACPCAAVLAGTLAVITRRYLVTPTHDDRAVTP
jgi:MFS family permease